MAITHNLPLSRWYYEATSEWTLDYPPLFAYFEKVGIFYTKCFVVRNSIGNKILQGFQYLATIAYHFGMEDILAIQKEALFCNRVLYFQRLSVIATDVLYVSSVELLSLHFFLPFTFFLFVLLLV